MQKTRDWKEFTHFGGLDWATDHHDVVIVDAQGYIVAQWRFTHTAQGWKDFATQLAAYPLLAIAVETSQGLLIEQLLDLDLAVYPVQPKSAQRYRDRKAPSGTKTDQLDAWALADALRMDGQHWRVLHKLDPLVQELRLLCRDEVSLIEQRTSLAVQLQDALRTYYPTALEAFSDWTAESSWAFIEAFPTPQALVSAQKRKWEKFLHTHRLWRELTAPKKYELFAQATLLCGSLAVTEAKSRLALALVKMLKVLGKELRNYRTRIEELFAKHPDHDLFGSLPGAGPKLTARLLSELGDDRNLFASAQALQSYAGMSPVSYQSGQIHKVHLRRHCNKHLRAAVHLWSDLSRKFCSWAQAYYLAHRKKGQSHASAIRCLGNRWLKILFKMWQTRTAYDENLHTRNQIKHGSWLIQLQPEPQKN